MKNTLLSLYCLIFLLASSCSDDFYDPLGDLIVNLNPGSDNPRQNPLISNLSLGLFPSESLVTNTFTADLAFQTVVVDLDDERIVFTNILPGTYVVAFVANSSDQSVPRQVVQVTADNVEVVDLYF